MLVLGVHRVLGRRVHLLMVYREAYRRGTPPRYPEGIQGGIPGYTHHGTHTVRHSGLYPPWYTGRHIYPGVPPTKGTQGGIYTTLRRGASLP